MQEALIPDGGEGGGEESALRVLLVDDSSGDRTLVARELRRQFPNVRIDEAGDRRTLDEALREGSFDLVVTDYHLGWSDGIAVLAAVRARKPDCPVIMFTGTGSEEIAVHAMKAGLDDYVLKSPKHFGRLPGTIHSVMKRAMARHAKQEAETRYRNLFERVPIGLYRRAPDGTILEANPALVRILGYPDRETLMAPDVPESSDDRAQWERLANELGESGEPQTREFQLRRLDGELIWAEVDVRAIRGPEGQVRYLEGALEDISARKLAQQLLHDSLDQVRGLFDATVMALTAVSEWRDAYTAGHQRRVAQLSCAIAVEVGMEASEIEGIRVAALLHDIGKIAVPHEILARPGVLSEVEFDLVKVHPQVGYEILRVVPFPWPVAQTVLRHHNRLDGSGYPLLPSGEQLGPEVRVLSVADVVEAMSSDRPYRPAHDIDLALQEVMLHADVKYDREVVRACVTLFRDKGFAWEVDGLH
jgi:PAS domain S-box-containing protein/putative nucleotidyltransferase with HDIG domain